MKPVVIWNLTRRCNLRCRHCYTTSRRHPVSGRAQPRPGDGVLDDLAGFGIPALILSGGEPLSRFDFFDTRRAGAGAELPSPVAVDQWHAADRRHRPARRRTGLRLCRHLARRHRRDQRLVPRRRRRISSGPRGRSGLQGAGRQGRPALHHHRRQRASAAGDARSLRQRGRRQVLSLAPRLCRARRQAPRRGCGARAHAPSHGPADRSRLGRRSPRAGRSRSSPATTMPTRSISCAGCERNFGEEKAAHVRSHLEAWGGNSSGLGVANIDPQGKVHPDTYWSDYTVGSVQGDAVLGVCGPAAIRCWRHCASGPRPLKGRCGACAFKAVCGGNTRIRALQLTGDPWEEDPACYLTNARDRAGGGNTAPRRHAIPGEEP